MAITILGGRGFVLGEYVKQYYHHAVGNIASINEREDYNVYSEDVLYGISTLHNFHVFSDPYLDINTNLTTLVKVLENWKRCQDRTGIKGCFNFLSSWSVYGSGHEPPVPETADCRPTGFYISTKFCAENLLKSFCIAHGLKYRILRMANILGPDPKVSKQKNQLQYNFNLLAQNKDVELFGDGLFFRDFLHVEDAARAIELVMVRGNENEIYNIGNGNLKNRIMFYGTILQYAANLLHSKGTIIYKPPTEFQSKVPVASFYMDVSKLHALGFVPKYVNEDIFKAMILER
jgi:nucleoside-diphosphate-sugar epimerase